MASGREEGPVYYREIQKNAYLKRIPNEVTGGKLRPLGSKKVPLKPMWTQFCVHNGRTPYLEQYPEAESPATASHKPVWRACLLTARHVTASVKPHSGDQYDFLIDTDHGPVRMLAPDWESMQDWVTTLRNTLHELKIVSKGENVYCTSRPAPRPAPAPRAAARDPTSPLPPTPATPPDRVPGIEPVTTRTTTEAPRQTESTPTTPETTEPQTQPIQPLSTEPEREESIDISNWDSTLSTPSTSQGTGSTDARKTSTDTRKSSTDLRKNDARRVAKICGQNICLDDSLFNRTTTESDEEFFAEIDRMSDGDEDEYKQRVVVSNGEKETNGESSNHQSTNITVIQVSNKEPPHTAIPVLGPETNVFDFDFKQKVTVSDPTDPNFVNIVNTEENEYGTTFGTKESEYGHLSLTTTVSLSGTSEFLNQTVSNQSNSNQAISNQSTNRVVNHKPTNQANSNQEFNQTVAKNSNQLSSNLEEVYERLCMASTSNSKPSPLPVKKLKSIDKSRKSSLPNLEVNESTYEYLFLSNNNSSEVNCNGERVQVNSGSNVEPLNRVQVNSGSNIEPLNRVQVNSSPNIEAQNRVQMNSGSNNEPINRVQLNSVSNEPINRVHMNSGSNSDSQNRVQVNSGSNSDPLSRVRSVERSRSQNAYDSTPRVRENVNRRVQNNSPKREIKNETTEQSSAHKPIWKRGLTELSLLTRLRSIGQNKKQESPTRHDDNHDRGPTANSPGKVVHRSRPEGRVDSGRRRSSSLSNGQSPHPPSAPPLVTLRARQAASLRAEQRRGAAVVSTISTRDAPVFADYDNQVWLAWWGGAAARAGGRAGDRVAALRGRSVASAAHARALLHLNNHTVDILFHRVPLGKIFVINKRDQESIGIKLDSECNITRVSADSGAAMAGIPPPGQWALTEINNRPINLIKGGEDDMNRLSRHGTEVSALIQPSALVKKLRTAVKGNKSLLGLR